MNMPLVGLVSSTTNNSFISPMRGGATAAVPGHQLQSQHHQQSNTSHVVNSASNLLSSIGHNNPGGSSFIKSVANYPTINIANHLNRDLSPYQLGIKKKSSNLLEVWFLI
jgi:hypothetical protein